MDGHSVKRALFVFALALPALAQFTPPDNNGGGCNALAGDVTGACGANSVVKVNGGSVPASAPFVGTNSSNQVILASPFSTNAQTSTYQVLAADFSGYKTIIVASGTFTITLVASGAQPATGQSIRVINYGSGVVTIARSGQNINGGTATLVLAAGSAAAPTDAFVVSNGTNYFAELSSLGASPAGSAGCPQLSNTSTLACGPKFGYDISSLNPGIFFGAGLNDLTFGGTYTDGITNPAALFAVKISVAAGTDSFQWKKNGGAFSGSIAITRAEQALSDGVTVTFGATTGHTLNDSWTIRTVAELFNGPDSTQSYQGLFPYLYLGDPIASLGADMQTEILSGGLSVTLVDNPSTAALFTSQRSTATVNSGGNADGLYVLSGFYGNGNQSTAWIESIHYGDGTNTGTNNIVGLEVFPAQADPIRVIDSIVNYESVIDFFDQTNMAANLAGITNAVHFKSQGVSNENAGTTPVTTESHFWAADDNPFGTPVTPATSYGFRADDLLGTTAYGFHSDVAAASGHWAFYGAGSAASHLGGVLDLPNEILTAAAPTVAAAQVGIGSTTAAAANCNVAVPTPTACLVINVAGTTRYVPYY